MNTRTLTQPFTPPERPFGWGFLLGGIVISALLGLLLAGALTAQAAAGDMRLLCSGSRSLRASSAPLGTQAVSFAHVKTGGTYAAGGIELSLATLATALGASATKTIQAVDHAWITPTIADQTDYRLEYVPGLGVLRVFHTRSENSAAFAEDMDTMIEVEDGATVPTWAFFGLCHR